MRIIKGRIVFNSEVKRGGARAGAGRKKSIQPEASRKNHSIYVSDEEFYVVKRFIKDIRQNGYCEWIELE